MNAITTYTTQETINCQKESESGVSATFPFLPFPQDSSVLKCLCDLEAQNRKMSVGISRSQGFINCIRRRILLLLVNSLPIWHCIPDIHHPGSNKRPKRVENRRQRHFLFCLSHWIPPYWSFFVTWKPNPVKCPSRFPDPPESKKCHSATETDPFR